MTAGGGQTGLPVFVYGSLRDLAVRARVLGERAAGLTTCPAVLRGYALQRVPSFDYPFVVPAGPADRVDGELLLGLDDAALRVLDSYEDVDDGLYTRAQVNVEASDGPADAWVYLRGPVAPS